MFGRLLQKNIATIEKNGMTYFCDLRAIPLPQGGEGKRLYCHATQSKLKGMFGDIVTANNVEYDCELRPMWHGGKQLYCRQNKTKFPIPNIQKYKTEIDFINAVKREKYRKIPKKTWDELTKEEKEKARRIMAKQTGDVGLLKGDISKWYEWFDNYEYNPKTLTPISPPEIDKEKLANMWIKFQLSRPTAKTTINFQGKKVHVGDRIAYGMFGDRGTLIHIIPETGFPIIKTDRGKIFVDYQKTARPF